eukprot:gb/GECG01013330.1/.p1 GENE.gb/GECG01013330.1/~~gb/GECG01013330.1/.p1  ORF type:complete len:571 (+),score=54.23 gb/GECG01013330.1/:1-1713(+)
MSESNSLHWLNAYEDRVAGLHVHQECCQLADVQGDNDWELLLATPDKKLKLFKNSQVRTELNVLDVPNAICAFIVDRQSSLPAVAVSSGPYVFVYRNLRPYFKFKVPEEKVDRSEKGIWDNARSKSAADLKTELKQLQDDPEVNLTVRSRQFLALETNEEQEEFMDRLASVPLVSHTVVTCLGKLKRNSLDQSESDHLVVGTESGQVLVLQSGANAIEQHYNLPSVPVGISASGIWETESRIVVGCRNGRLYTIRNKKKVTTEFDTASPIVGFCLVQQELFVACSDQSFQCYHVKGRKLWTMRFDKKISSVFPLTTETMSACLVGFENGNVKTLTSEGKEMLHETGPDEVNDSVSAIRFGRFGREDHCLIICFRSGALKVKIIPRRVVSGELLANQSNKSEESSSLNIPKKTRLYVEQTQREQAEFRKMHHLFQKELCRLRLDTARSYVKLISSGYSHVSSGRSKRIGLNARIQGIGPHFVLLVDVTNQGNESISGTILTFNFDGGLYSVSPPQLHLPVLVPHVTSTFSTHVNTAQEELSGQIFSMLSDSSQEGLPLVSALVKMPAPAEI